MYILTELLCACGVHSNDYGETVFMAVATEETAHIMELVSKQVSGDCDPDFDSDSEVIKFYITINTLCFKKAWCHTLAITSSVVNRF